MFHATDWATRRREKRRGEGGGGPFFQLSLKQGTVGTVR
jgi:hypothetical protein